MKIAQVLCLKDNGSPLEKICLWERLKGLEISPLTSVCNVLCKWAIPRFQFPSCLIGLSRCTFFPSTFARCNSMIEGVDILFVQTPCFWVFNFYHDLFPWMLIGGLSFIVQEIIFKFTNQCKLIVSKDWKIRKSELKWFLTLYLWCNFTLHEYIIMFFCWITSIFDLDRKIIMYRIVRDAWIRSLNKKTIRSNPSYGLI